MQISPSRPLRAVHRVGHRYPGVWSRGVHRSPTRPFPPVTPRAPAVAPGTACRPAVIALAVAAAALTAALTAATALAVVAAALTAATALAVAAAALARPRSRPRAELKPRPRSQLPTAVAPRSA